MGTLRHRALIADEVAAQKLGGAVALAAVREAGACVDLLGKVAAPERVIRSAEDLTPEERQAIVRSVFPDGPPPALAPADGHGANRVRILGPRHHALDATS